MGDFKTRNQSCIDMEVHYWKDRDAYLYLKKDHREFSLPP
jgi:hypothetical protein